MDDGLTLAVGGTAIGALCTLAASWIKARFSRTEIAPQPLEVKPSPRYADRAENDAAHANIFARLAALEKSGASQEARLDRIEASLDRLDEKMDRVTILITQIARDSK